MSDKKKPEPSDAALQERLTQLELENRMRHRFNSISEGAAPFKHTPRKGFGSAQGIAHLRHTEYQRRGPAPAAPAPMIPEPGKAKFGGTYLRTPLPGLLSGHGGNPWEELITPVPARRSGDQSTDGGGRPPVAGGPAAPTNHPRRRAEDRPAPSAETERDLPPAESVPTQPAAKSPPEAGGQKVVGGSGVPKAPLPPVYHAGMRAAEQSQTPEATIPGVPPSDGPITIPKEAEVRNDEPVKTVRIRKFKNPTLGPTPES